MSRETLNLICAELPGAEREDRDGGTLWTAAHEPFARVEADGITVSVLRGGAWEASGPDTPPATLRDRIAEAYTEARHRLPEEVRVTLDRTSG